MDIATLGLTIENGQAVLKITQTGNALDVLGQKGEEAAAKVAKAGAAARKSATDHESLAGATVSSTRGMGTLDAAMAEATHHAGEHSIAVGRLERNYESLVAELLGVNDTLALTATSFAKFGLGELSSLGILAGLAAVGFAYEKISEDARKSAEEQDKAFDSLVKLQHQQSLGAGGETTAAIQKVTEHRDDLKERLAAFDKDLEAQVRSGKVALSPAQLAMIEAGKYDPNATGALRTVALNRQAIVNQINPANRMLAAGENDVGPKVQAAAESTEQKRVQDYVTLLSQKTATAQQRSDALDLLHGYQTELAELKRLRPTDISAQSQVSGLADALTNALFPKKDASAAASLTEARFKALNDEIDHTTASLVRMLPEGVKPGTMDVFAAFGRTNPLDEHALQRGVQADLRASTASSPYADAFNSFDHASVLQAKLDADNAAREAHGQKALGPGKELLDAKQAAADYGAAMIDAITKSNASWEAQKQLIDAIIKKMHEAGVGPKDMQPSGFQKIAGDVSSGLHTAGDLANLIGGSRGSQYANILNTAANATTNVTSAIMQGGANPIADAQAVLSVASLGKEVFGLGKQSHDAARQVAEASEAVKNMLAQLQASVAHDALGSLLAQAQAADDARRKEINDDLSGKKKEKERNAALAQDEQLYQQQLTQIKEQFGKQQVLDEQSLQGRLLRARGLDYQADQVDLAVQQQEEYNKAVQDGRDAAYLATLAQVQLAEKTKLANDAITQLANAPTGFFAERYFGPYAIPTVTPPSNTGTGSSAGTTTNFNAPINITVPDAGNPAATARAVVHAIRTFRDQSVGNGGTMADAMELM